MRKRTGAYTPDGLYRKQYSTEIFQNQYKYARGKKRTDAAYSARGVSREPARLNFRAGSAGFCLGAVRSGAQVNGASFFF